MDKILEQERVKYKKMWQQKSYRENSPGLNVAPEVFKKLRMKAGETITDYGCGTGRAVKWFSGQGMHARGMDFIDNAFEYKKDKHCFFEKANLWGLTTFWFCPDWFFCCDVLEHIPEERIETVLINIRNYNKKGGYFQICNRPATQGFQYGLGDLHVTKWSFRKWGKLLIEYFVKCNYAIESFEIDGSTTGFYLRKK